MARVQRTGAIVWLVALVAACTPALNWRDVPVGAISAMLPCKPDLGTRTVRLLDQDWLMHMSGCEAAGALYAISYLQLTDTAMSSTVSEAWRLSALSRMQAAPIPGTAMAPISGTTAGGLIQAKGRQADGSAVQAQLRWFLVGTQLFHAAVYAPRLSTEMTEPFFSDLPALSVAP